jgi:hypothetical protein
MGTLWSMAVDVSAPAVAIRFGPPPNSWRPFTLEGVAGTTAHDAYYPMLA